MSKEQDQKFFRTFAAVLAGLFGFMLIAIFAARFIASSSGDKKAYESTNNAKIEQRIKPVGEVNTSQKAAEQSAKKTTAKESTATASASGANLGEQTYKNVCIACHGMGVAGAPKFGDKQAWAPHIAKGLATLYDHALHGFTGSKGMMPAKGGRTDLSDAAVKAAVRYMVSHSGGKVDTSDSKPASSTDNASTAKSSGASDTQQQSDASDKGSAAAPMADLSKGKEVFGKVCTACHTPGAAGAPKIGDKQAWAPRIAKGIATLDQHALHGFAGNSGIMPPKGGMASLSDQDVKDAVAYMVHESR